MNLCENCNCVSVLLFYWFCCFHGTGTDRKNLAGLRSYPDTVQLAVREHPVFGQSAPQGKSIVSILFGNLLLFTVVFSVLGFALKNILGLADLANILPRGIRFSAKWLR